MRTRRLTAVVAATWLACCGARVNSSSAEQGAADEGSLDTEAESTERSRGLDAAATLSVQYTPPLAPGCADTKVVSTNDSCHVRAACDNDALRLTCTSSSATRWTCTCYSDAAYGTFEVAGPDEALPCEAVLGICPLAGRATAELQPQCVPTFWEHNSDYCQLATRCTWQHDLGAGFTAFAESEQRASCTSDGSTSSCSCSNSTGTGVYTLSRIETADACQTAQSLCTEETPPSNTDDCTLQAQLEEPNKCNLQRTCLLTYPLTGEARAHQYGPEHAACTLEQGTWQCSCAAAARTLNAEMSEAQFGGCEAVLQLCRSPEPPFPTGSPTCELVAGNAELDACRFDLACTQEAQVGEDSALLHGSAHVGCQRIAGTWECECGSSTQTRLFELDGDEAWDAWEACNEASAVCSKRLTDVVGPYHRDCIHCVD